MLSCPSEEQSQGETESDKHVWHISISENTMKKLLSMGLLTLCALAASEREAQAWVNAKFSVGLNWQLQSANNNVFWGAWKNGQVPGPEAFGGGGGGGGPGMYGPGGMGQPPAGQFPYFGAQPMPQPMPQAQSFQGMPQGFPTETAPPPSFTQAPPQQQQAHNYGAQNYYNPYQTVSYQQGGYYYPNYYAAQPQAYGYGYGYGYQAQTPSYWYNNR
jgi:hypothetical protein